jgi:hypothetical protein
VDGFYLGEVADDLGVDPGDGLEFSGPVLGVMGPGDPGRGVRGPLGGHAVVGRLLVGAQWVPPTRQKVCKVFQSHGLSLDLPAPQDRCDDLKQSPGGPMGSATCQVQQSP